MRSSLTRVIAASAVALVLVGSTSIAFGRTGPSDRLRLFFGDKGMAVWQSGTDDQGILVDDSPLDSNHARLGLYVPADDMLDVTGTDYDYAGAFAKNTGLAGRSLPRVRNLSFDFLKASAGATVGGGNPRFSIPIDLDGDGDWDGFAFAAAGDCEASIGATWSRADFTGRVTVGCTLFGHDGVAYSSDGTESAWKNYADAFPTARIAKEDSAVAFVIHDDGSDGASWVDRIAFQNRMFVMPGTGPSSIRRCFTESSC
jgi:hypothetical protein